MQQRNILPHIIALAMSLLTGCSTISESECKVADWRRLGYEDAVAGRPISRIAGYHKDCGKVQITPDASLYRAGWDAGIDNYCQPTVGWNEGKLGRDYAEVCRGRRGESDFLRNYRAGRAVNAAEGSLHRNDAEIRRLEQELGKAKTDQDKSRIRDRLRDLDLQQTRLRAELAALPRFGP